MRSRKHTEITRVVESLFPKLFGFEYCSILFAEQASGNFFKIILIDKVFRTDEEKARMDDDEGGERQEEHNKS